MLYLGDWIRILLFLTLLYFVWDETGPLTTFCIFLIIYRAEVQDCNEGRTFKDNSHANAKGA